MATTDRRFEMGESTAGSLDAMELPELSDAVWMRLLANALDPDAPPADPGLIPLDIPYTWSDSDQTGGSGPDDGLSPDGDDVFDEGADRDVDAVAGQVDDGGAALLPLHDPALDEPAGNLGHGPAGDAPGGPWTEPNDDSAF